MKFVALLSFVLFAIANSTILSEFEEFGNVNAPNIGASIAKPTILERGKFRTSFTYPEGGVQSGKHIIKGYKVIAVRTQLPKIEKVGGGFGEKFIRFNVTSKYVGQMIDTVFLFYGDDIATNEQSVEQTSKAKEENAQIAKNDGNEKKDGAIVKAFKSIAKSFGFKSWKKQKSSK